jgi:hypothetical protein
MGTAWPFSFGGISLSVEGLCSIKDLVATVISCAGIDVVDDVDDDDDDDDTVVQVVVM